MILFDGKLHAEKLEDQILNAPKTFKEKELAIIQIGDNESSEKYVSLKLKVCKRLGIPVGLYRLDYKSQPDAEITKQLLLKLSEDASVGSIIVQLPLPEASLYPLLDLLPQAKDIDILGKESKNLFYTGVSEFESPVVRGVRYFLGTMLPPKAEPLRACIIGYGELVGKPASYFLKSQGYSVEININYNAGDRLDYDLIILSAGIPNLVNPQDIKSGCNVIDFGSSVLNGKTTGDLNLNHSLDHLGVVSPSPGGMGPLVVRFLLMNHLHI